MSNPDRFWEKVDVRGPDECWPWTASTDPRGYGQIKWEPRARAHRVAWFLAHDSWPPTAEGLEIDHVCNNPGCVNVRHMELVTKAENNRRRDARLGNPAARKDRCKRGHALVPGNLYKARPGLRVCAECKRQRARRQYAEWKARKILGKE